MPIAPLLIGTALAMAPWQQTVPLGEPVEKVDCQAAPGQSYALYLPSSYTPEKQWPILYAFDPRRRGMIPVNLFRKAAERHGFIIASSNNFVSDTPEIDDTLAAQNAIWNDTQARLSIDPRRIYSTGFSGGARISWIFEYRTEGFPFAGIIGAGAGLPGKKIPDAWDPSHMAFYGLAGETGFNYYEMVQLDELLEKRGVPHRFSSFDGAHEWPPEELCNQALDWMQLQAFKGGLAPVDEAFVDEFFAQQLSQASQAQSEGRLIEAYEILKAASRDFEGLKDTSPVTQQLAGLKTSKVLAQSLNKRRKEGKKAAQYQHKAVAVLDQIRNAEREDLPGLRDVMFNMQLRTLLKKGASQDREESLAAWRVLETVFVQTVFYMPREFKQRGDMDRAILCLELATRIKPDNPYPWYNLARVHAQSDQPSSALESLKKALELGFNRPDLLESDSELAPLQGKPEFEKLKQGLAKKDQ